ncbi:hypothetical protein [Planobispora rosea]|uniref:hypothetical protein n=1 Tax=Planobispora rosea TaxID=35762 RepID=UPI001C3FFBBF|nr:hypothetical protein [Planobispora rosea]
MNGDEQPGLDEIEQCFIAVLDGRMSRDEADRWAGRWVADDDLVWNDVARWGTEPSARDRPAQRSGRKLPA